MAWSTSRGEDRHGAAYEYADSCPPPSGLGLATGVSVALGVVAWRRGRAPWVYLPLGTLLYSASLVGAWMIIQA
ncbi:hypothetical protein [Streptomyces sp. NPDC056549]|uniref:hypothetical protein n=1 Tax=Streptomyces sp. NPDC056549 TaxID=3345864 RepID=UPI00369F510B